MIFVHACTAVFIGDASYYFANFAKLTEWSMSVIRYSFVGCYVPLHVPTKPCFILLSNAELNDYTAKTEEVRIYM